MAAACQPHKASERRQMMTTIMCTPMKHMAIPCMQSLQGSFIGCLYTCRQSASPVQSLLACLLEPNPS